jgi:hypothetical protein
MRSFTPQAAQHGSLPVAYGTFLRFSHSSEPVNTPKHPADYIHVLVAKLLNPLFPRERGRYFTSFQDPHPFTHLELLSHHEVASLVRAGAASVCQCL